MKQALEGAEAVEAKDAASRLQATQRKIEALEKIEKKYKGTEVAEKAKKRLEKERAEALFQAAVAFADEHPTEREAAAKRFREVVDKYSNTEAAHKAERKLDGLEDVERKKVLRLLHEARQRAAALVEKQRFGQASRQFNRLLKDTDREDIKQSILQQRLVITTRAESAYEAIHGRAQEKAKGGYYEEAIALYSRVAVDFDLEPYVGKAKAQLAIIRPLVRGAKRRRLEAIDAAKYQFFLLRLEPSLERASGWDVDGAAQEAEKLRKDLRTAGIENYLEAYLADLDLIRSLKRRAIRRLNDEAAPVVAKQFSLGKVGGRFDKNWLEAKVRRADEKRVVLRYGQVDVHRAWPQFPPDELYRLGKLATDPQHPQGHLLLGVHCLHARLLKTARREFNVAKASGLDVESYLRRIELFKGAAKPHAPETKEEEASRLFMEAKRFMNERVWDRALHRLVLLRSRHATKQLDISANLAEINQRIAVCKRHVEKLEMEANLALGRAVPLLRGSLFDEWQKRFGKWTIEKGILRGESTEDHDAECLFSLRHPPSYELRVKVRVHQGPGVILRLAGKARPNLGFWLNTSNPALVGLLRAAAGDQKAAQRTVRRFPFQPNEWYELRAVVNRAFVEVSVGEKYAVRTANTLPADPEGVQTYGFLVNPKSAAEFRDFSVRVLQEQ